MKQCSKCKIEKTLTEFYSDSRRPMGLQSHCKVCFINQHKSYRKSTGFKKWRRLYRDKNKGKINKQHLKWAKSIQGKIYMKNYRQKEKHKIYKRAYEVKYRKREYVRFKDLLNTLAYVAKKKSNSDKTVTYESALKLLSRQNNKCNMCKKDFSQIKKHLDHIYPISKGGLHSIKNVQWLCYVCNIRKSNKIF